MLKIKPLPEELQKIAERELGEKPENIPKYLQLLRSWIEQQPHLNARLDEQFLVQYLRGCKYDLDKAKKKIDLFFTLKTKFPKFANATDVNESTFRKNQSYGLGVPLPRPLNDTGARLYFMKFDGDVAKGLVDMDDLYSVFTAMHEIMIMEDPYACINGIIYILDLKTVNLTLASKYTPAFLKKLVQFLEKSLPLRLKAAYLINTPTFFYNVMTIMLPMLSEKLRKRMHIYDQNYDDMFTKIPQKYLPTDLGGENGTNRELVKDFEKKWLEYDNYFKENINYGTNELLRPGGAIDFDSIYGMGGAFRKLEVD